MSTAVLGPGPSNEPSLGSSFRRRWRVAFEKQQYVAALGGVARACDLWERKTLFCIYLHVLYSDLLRRHRVDEKNALKKRQAICSRQQVRIDKPGLQNASPPTSG